MPLAAYLAVLCLCRGNMPWCLFDAVRIDLPSQNAWVPTLLIILGLAYLRSKVLVELGLPQVASRDRNGRVAPERY
jgi:hypothetical protein